MKKFSWVLILTMVVSLFCVHPSALVAQAAIGDFFTPVTTYFSNDFNSGTFGDLPANVSTNASTSDYSYTVSDGALVFNRGSGNGNAQIHFYFYSDRSKLAFGGDGDIYCVDIILQRSQSKLSYCAIGGNAHAIRSYLSNYNYGVGEYTNFRYIVDTKNKTQMVLNGSTILEAGAFFGDATWLANFTLDASGGNAGSMTEFKIDEISMYSVSRKQYDNVYNFYNSVNDSAILGSNTSLDSVTSDLVLSDTVTWSSSNEAVISSDGKVTRPSWGYPATPVTLTASVTNPYLSKTFDVSVVRADIAKPDSIDGDYYLYDDFSSGSFADRNATFGGAAAEVKDGKLVLENNDSGESQFLYYVNSDQSALSGGSNVYAIEFDAKKELTDTDARSAFYIRLVTADSWRTYCTNYVRASISDAALGLSGKRYYDSSVNHYKYIMDTANGTYSLYVNGMLEVYEEARNTLYNPYTNLQAIQIVCQTGSMKLSLDNFKVYKLAAKTYQTGFGAYELTKLGEKMSVVDSAGIYEANVSYLATGLAAAPDASSLPVCAVASYADGELTGIKVCMPTVITYSATDGVYGYWYPQASLGIAQEEVGATSIKTFLWNTLTPVDEAIYAASLDGK